MSDLATDAALVRAQDALFGGDPATAAALLRPLIAEAPALYEARYWLASTLAAAGDAPGASRVLDDARTLHAALTARGMGADIARCRADGAHASEVAAILYDNHHPAMSAEIGGLAVTAGQITQKALLTYSLALMHQGRVEAAIRGFQAAAESFPSAAVHQFLLFPHLFAEDGDRRFSTEARRWAELYAPPPGPRPFAHAGRAGRRLRIGYVAPNFSRCQVRQFMAPVIEAHDPATTQVFLYPADASTEVGWPAGVEVRPIGQLDDGGAADLIRRDRIDVLADCWGHTAGGRLGVFARRAAPVQVGWINFVQTTGLGEMDYILHADDGGEPADPSLYTEAIWPIGPVFTAFRPSSETLDPTPTPALRTGAVTFGSFNHPAKLTDPTLAAWAAILKGTGGSRLLLKYRYFVDPVLQRVTRARFAALGVRPERLVFEGQSSGAEYLAAFSGVDLALDPWPAPGSTTTLEALSNGVPVLVLSGAGVTTPAHYPASMLQAAGLAELVCRTPKDYVRRAIAVASDIEALDALRARVRPGLDAGPLRDEVGFTRRLEQAFAQMFDRWCKASGRVQAVA